MQKKYLENEKMKKIVSGGGFFKLTDDKKAFTRSNNIT